MGIKRKHLTKTKTTTKKETNAKKKQRRNLTADFTLGSKASVFPFRVATEVVVESQLKENVCVVENTFSDFKV